MTFEEKAEIVINQLRADRDRLMGAIEKIKDEIRKALDAEGDSESAKAQALALMWVLELFDKYAEQEPCDDEITLKVKRGALKSRQGDMVIYNVEWLKKNWQMEMDIVCGVKPCDDVVSRQAVLDIVNNPLNIRLDEIIKKLPPARPQEQTGHWIYKEYYPTEKSILECSECGEEIEASKSYYDSCPVCGAIMVEQKVSEEKRMTDQWQELKETVIELRDNDGTGTQQEVCKFLANYMEVLEKQMVEPQESEDKE